MEGRDVELWQRPQRRSELTRLTVDHVMASSALPMLFPAVRVGGEWFGDGGVRLTAPLSPALHLGATRILTIATRYLRTRAEADRPLTDGYPPPAQVLSTLYNAIFLDLIDEDIIRLQKINRLIEDLPETAREGMRVVEILVMRPSEDLGKLARAFELRSRESLGGLRVGDLGHAFDVEAARHLRICGTAGDAEARFDLGDVCLRLVGLGRDFRGRHADQRIVRPDAAAAFDRRGDHAAVDLGRDLGLLLRDERAAGELWRSRFDADRNLIIVNSGHRDFVFATRNRALQLRYLVRLYVKELVLHNFAGVPAEQLLERMIELSLYAEEKLRPGG